MQLQKTYGSSNIDKDIINNISQNKSNISIVLNKQKNYIYSLIQKNDTKSINNFIAYNNIINNIKDSINYTKAINNKNGLDIVLLDIYVSIVYNCLSCT